MGSENLWMVSLFLERSKLGESTKFITYSTIFPDVVSSEPPQHLQTFKKSSLGHPPENAQHLLLNNPNQR